MLNCTHNYIFKEHDKCVPDITNPLGLQFYKIKDVD